MGQHDWEAAEHEVSEKVAKIVAESRAKFFDPCTTDAQRTERILRDIRMTFGGPAASHALRAEESGVGVGDGDGDGDGDIDLWPLRHVLASPFMFLEDPTAEGFGLGLALDADAAASLHAFRAELEAASTEEGRYPWGFQHRGRSIATCAVMNGRDNWIAKFEGAPALLFGTNVMLLYSSQKNHIKRVTRGLHSPEELDAFYAQVTQLYSFDKFWAYFDPFQMIENVPDEVIFSALSYLPASHSVRFIRKALAAGRTETVKSLLRSEDIFVGESEREQLVNDFLSEATNRVMKTCRDVLSRVSTRVPAGASESDVLECTCREFLDDMWRHLIPLDIGFRLLLPALGVSAEERNVLAGTIFVDRVDRGCRLPRACPPTKPQEGEDPRCLLVFSETENAVRSVLQKIGHTIYAEIASADPDVSVEKIVLRAVESKLQNDASFPHGG